MSIGEMSVNQRRTLMTFLPEQNKTVLFEKTNKQTNKPHIHTQNGVQFLDMDSIVENKTVFFGLRSIKTFTLRQCVR